MPPYSLCHIGRPLGPSIATVRFLKLLTNSMVPSISGALSTSAMRSSSVRPSGVPIVCCHSTRPS